MTTSIDPQAATAAEFMRLADIVEPLSADGWETPSLCAGWRIREVVAHMTMAARYQPAEFVAELQECKGDFTALSNRVAERDGALPTETLVGNLRDETMHGWTPPGSDALGALNHVVIHGLDITTPLGIERPADAAVLAVLEQLTEGGVHRYFGTDLEGIRLEATDADWTFGSGTRTAGTASELVLWLTGRQLPADRIAS